MSSDDDFGVPIPGRILPAEQWAKTAIKRLPPPGTLDFAAIFGRVAPLVLDLGCGNGRFVIASALARPECDHLGIDILPLVLRYATRRANQRGLSNVRLAAIGGYELLDEYIAPGSIAEIHLYHPQPFRDGENKHKRLITPEFLALVRQSLSTEGLLVLQTDNRAYWQYIRRVAPLLFEFEELAGTWPDAPQGRTRREIYARQHKLKIFRGQGRPRGELSAADIAEIVRREPSPRFDA
ncbi:MAG: methyltransferase domain-containing protein [Pirellulaceae bacterium]|nr:methyltransferase domain-containing protein [Pirellulaceae bacterium]